MSQFLLLCFPLVGTLFATFYVARNYGTAVAVVVAGVIAIALHGTSILLIRRIEPPFDVTSDDRTATFTFRDLGLGYEFKAVNAPDAPEFATPKK